MSATVWLLGATVAIGLGLGAMALLDRRPNRMLVAAHGLAGAAGSVLLLAALWQGGSEAQTSSRLAVVMVVAALAGGAVIALARARGRAPPGLLTLLHAACGAAGLALLAAL